VAVLAARQWSAIAGAALSSSALLLFGLVMLGWDANAAWLSQAPVFVSIARDGLVGWPKLASLYASMRQLGLGESGAFAIHLTVAALAAIAVWRVWRSDADYLAKAALLSAATMLASPYLFLYDTLFLVIPFLWLASARVSPAVLIALWFLPFFSIFQIAKGAGPINPAPLVPIALTLLIWRQLYPRLTSGVERPAPSV
jgi:hypothetical protein